MSRQNGRNCAENYFKFIVLTDKVWISIGNIDRWIRMGYIVYMYHGINEPVGLEAWYISFDIFIEVNLKFSSFDINWSTHILDPRIVNDSLCLQTNYCSPFFQYGLPLSAQLLKVNPHGPSARL